MSIVNRFIGYTAAGAVAAGLALAAASPAAAAPVNVGNHTPAETKSMCTFFNGTYGPPTAQTGATCYFPDGGATLCDKKNNCTHHPPEASRPTVSPPAVGSDNNGVAA